MPTHSVFLPGKSYAQRSLAGYSPYSHKELDRTEGLTHILSLPLAQPRKPKINIYEYKNRGANFISALYHIQDKCTKYILIFKIKFPSRLFLPHFYPHLPIPPKSRSNGSSGVIKMQRESFPCVWRHKQHRQKCRMTMVLHRQLKEILWVNIFLNSFVRRVASYLL